MSWPALRSRILPSRSLLSHPIASFHRSAPGLKKASSKPSSFQLPEGHGESIWVFCHRRSHQIVYSFDNTLNGFHALKQLPFNGKKTKPAKLRKDYWSPMACIRFPPGQGSAGRSVYQKLRELKHLHEVAWSDEVRYKRPDQYTSQDKERIEEKKAMGIQHRPPRSRQERGVVLNAQKTNAIADMAAVLAGQGLGNKMLLNAEATKDDDRLLKVSVSWSNDQDKGYAQTWSDNVAHDLLEGAAYGSGLSPEQATTAREAKPEVS